MDGMVFCEAGLSELLERHDSTLETLELSSIAFRYGSIKRFFVWLKSPLKLKIFKIWGFLKAFQYAQEKWLLRSRTFPCDKAWSDMTYEYYQGLFEQEFILRSGVTIWVANPKYLISEAVEAFVVRQGCWPTDLSPTAPAQDSRGFSAAGSNRDVINRAWNELPGGKYDIMWEVGWEDGVDSHGDEIIECHNDDGL
ncbi:hypothetical protein BKA64DRAFT_704481 [Cadophora sp. MPI-SDFR-AT-0126]|nr:hypothetical protein BKA64DRAFT_704481 [Leotiomycetes sp. MPI-SDFR-AT-0126]